MARTESRYVCGTCGAASLRWEGQCRACDSWNSLVETPAERAGAVRRRRTGSSPAISSLVVATEDELAGARRPLGIGELDRVLGGGLVDGSLVLLGGEPGIGKSTLLLALCAALVESGAGTVLYASGEESAGQVRLRAKRLGLQGSPLAERISVLNETSVDTVLSAAEESGPALLVVDSIQTMTADGLDGPQGTVGQLRESTARLQSYAKQRGVPVVLVGHVTKDGTLAGPKTLEHQVDVVLTLEGERFSGLRLLRASKNRFGSTEEVGVFEMSAAGLQPVSDPAAAFLEPSSLGAPGVAVAATLEGSRPLLVEIQALVAPAGHGSPRRTAAGLDQQRLALIIAVLSRRAGLNLAAHDVYASVVGGLTIEEPQADLPLALALASSLRDRPLIAGTVCCGEVGLTGELRPAAGLERRLREAARLGFSRALVPAATRDGGLEAALPEGLQVIRVPTLRDALRHALAPAVAAEGGAPALPPDAAEQAVPVLGSPTR